jgi:uncharacterized phage-associated protein
MHDSNKIANEFLRLAKQDGRALTPMQLLKLVFIAHGWMLGLYGRPLICDTVQAWKYGPVIPDLYRSIRHFRNNPVTGVLATIDGTDLDEFETDLINQVFENYGQYTGIQLSMLTHQAGSPWHMVYKPNQADTVISNDLIKLYYSVKALEPAAQI